MREFMMIRSRTGLLSLVLALSLSLGLCAQTAAATEPETESENLISYVAVKEEELTQTVAVGLAGEVSDIALTVEDTATGEQTTYDASELQEGLATFTISGEEPSLVSLQYTRNGEEETVDLSEAGLNPVEEEPDAYVEESEISLEVLDLASNATATQSALEAAMADEKLVVVLDPGHDATHAGAEGTISGKTYHEEELTLKIAQYCKAELEQYKGVQVYMTRTTGACPYGGSSVKSGVCNEKRADYAASVAADYYIAIHINSADASSAKGVEVYYPNANYKPEMNTYGQGMANSILNQLTAIGMTNRGAKIRNTANGTKYPDGTLADYYGLIRNPKLRNICGLIIEHGFISNASDVKKYLSSDTALQKLGVADAAGIANYLGLSKTQDNTAQYINTDPNKFTDDLGKGNWTWASSYIYACVEKGVINGFQDHTFRIDEGLTREQAAQIIDLAFQLTMGTGENKTFTDENQIQSWAADYVDRCVTNGIIKGYPDGSFRPQGTITRAEFAEMLAQAAGLQGGGTTGTRSFTFPDDNGQGDWTWAGDAIYACYAHGLIKGFEDGCFYPERTVTRGQAAKMIALAAGFVTE